MAGKDKRSAQRAYEYRNHGKRLRTFVNMARGLCFPPAHKPSPVPTNSGQDTQYLPFDASHKPSLEIFKVLVPFLGHLFRVRLSVRRLGLVFVKVACISWPAQVWHYGPVDFAVVESIPIDVTKPRMRFYCASSAFDVAQSFGRVDRAKPRNEIACIGRHGRGEAHAALYDPRENVSRAGKRWETPRTVRKSSWGSDPRRAVGQREIRIPKCQKPTNQPRFRDLLAVSTSLLGSATGHACIPNDFRSQVLGRTTQRVGLPCICQCVLRPTVRHVRTVFDLLCKAEVDQFEVAFGVYEDVLGLQVSVRDTFPLVQELQYEDNLGGIELRCGLIEAACSAQVAEDLTARAVVKLSMVSPRPGGILGWGRTNMYSESWSWKLATMVVMKGCPATAASTLRSLRTCSTCLRRITATHGR